MKELEYESVIAVRNEGVLHDLIVTKICVSFKVSDVFANREEKVDEYDVVIKGIQ